MNKFFFLIPVLLILCSCQGVKDALSGKKYEVNRTPKSHDGKFDVLTKLSNNFSVIDDVSGPLQWIHGHRAKVAKHDF